MTKPAKPVKSPVRRKLPPKPTEDTKVTLESIHAMTQHMTSKLKSINRLLPDMTMPQLHKLDKGLNTLMTDVRNLRDPLPNEPSFEKNSSKKWTPEMIFMDLLRDYVSDDIEEDDDYSDVKDMTISDAGLTQANVTTIIMRSVSGTKIKAPSFVRDDTATISELFETLKAAKVFRGRKGPIRDSDDHD